MTTSAQQAVLTDDERRCLRAVAQGSVQSSDIPTMEALAAKGMLDGAHASAVLTPAGQHAIHVSNPGIDT